MQRSFTLIELLIVIGILSVLVVTILITLNPAEAQKKARDTKRMKDLATLQAIIEQYINDGKVPFCTSGAAGVDGCASYMSGVANLTSCSDGWIRIPGGSGGTGAALCDYAKTIPIDPINSVMGTVIGGSVSSPQTLTNSNFRYRIKMEGSDYEINGFQESKSNIGNVINDGGQGVANNSNGAWWVELGSKLDLIN